MMVTSMEAVIAEGVRCREGHHVGLSLVSKSSFVPDFTVICPPSSTSIVRIVGAYTEQGRVGAAQRVVNGSLVGIGVLWQ